MILSKQTEYTATYQFGKTKVNMIGPNDVSEEEINKILEEIHTIGWKIIKQEFYNNETK